MMDHLWYSSNTSLLEFLVKVCYSMTDNTFFFSEDVALESIRRFNFCEVYDTPEVLCQKVFEKFGFKMIPFTTSEMYIEFFGLRETTIVVTNRSLRLTWFTGSFTFSRNLFSLVRSAD